MLRNYPSNKEKKSTSSNKHGSASCSKENPGRSTHDAIEYGPKGSGRKLLSEKKINNNQLREQYASVNKRLFDQEEEEPMEIESCEEQSGSKNKSFWHAQNILMSSYLLIRCINRGSYEQFI